MGKYVNVFVFVLLVEWTGEGLWFIMVLSDKVKMGNRVLY